MRRTLVLLLALGSSVADANSRVVVMTDADDAAAVQVALAGRGIDIQIVAAPQGDLRLDRAAAAERAAVEQHAAAAVWIDAVPGSTTACVVSADGEVFRDAPLPLVEGSPRMFAAIAVSLLDEVFTPTVAVPVVPLIPIGPVVPVAPIAQAATVETRVTASAPLLAAPKPPRFMLDIGGFAASRGISFEQDPNSSQNLDYPAQSFGGVAVSFAAYPWPEAGARDLSGLGFSLRIAKSMDSSFAAMDNSGYGNFTFDYTEVDGGVHYRHLMGPFAIDTELDTGKIESTIPDLPTDIVIPDTDYWYVGAGAHAYARTEFATFGVGGRYLHMESEGDITSEDWFGSASAYGYGFDASVMVPLPRSLYLKGTLNWTREHLDFEGSGTVAQQFGLWTVDDTSVMAAASLGITL
jgi:hypothetical protein